MAVLAETFDLLLISGNCTNLSRFMYKIILSGTFHLRLLLVFEQKKSVQNNLNAFNKFHYNFKLFSLTCLNNCVVC